MTTVKKYLDDSLLLNFDARCLGFSKWKGQPSILLEETAFYAESGGQLGDRGVIHLGSESVQVEDVQVDDQGRFHHVLAQDAALPAGFQDKRVQAQIDETHRRDMMSQHSGQHLLSSVCYRELGAETVSARLGRRLSTLDLDCGDLSLQDMLRMASLCNRLIMENRPMRALYPDAGELAKMELHRLPKVTTGVRIIEIEDYDLTPCGGTHCRATGEIGLLVVTGVERYKGMSRINFLCGMRVAARLHHQEARLRQLGDQLGCGAAGITEAVTKIQGDLKEKSGQLGLLRKRWVQQTAQTLLAANPPVEQGQTPILAIYEDTEVQDARGLAHALAQRPDVVALAAARKQVEDPWRVVLEAGSQTGFHAGQWFQTRAKALGGRGGGRPQKAEGTLPADISFEGVLK